MQSIRRVSQVRHNRLIEIPASRIAWTNAAICSANESGVR
jgi:hypothetical protein